MVIGLFLRELDPHPTFFPKSHTQTVLVMEVLVDLDIEVLDIQLLEPRERPVT